MKKTHIFILAAAIFALMVTPHRSFSQMLEETDVAPEKNITALEQRAIRKAAVNVMKHIIDAREAIQKKDYDTAKKRLNSSLRLINLIKETSSPVMVHDYIWVAKKHFSMDEVSEVTTDFVPIYSSLLEFEDFYPEATVRAHIQKAEEYLKKGNKADAKKELELGEEEITYIEADMPVEHTRKLVTEALEALAKNDPQKASIDLIKAEEGVQLNVTNVATPSLLAKTALWMASNAYDIKKLEKAEAEVKRAKKYLQDAINNMSTDEKYKTLDIIKDIDAVEGKILKGGDETGKQLKAIWNKSRGLEEQLAKTKKNRTP